jgi:hypothetical protein
LPGERGRILYDEIAMGLLNRLSADRQPKLPVEQPRLDRLDPFLGDLELRSAYRALVDGDWKALEAFLARSPKAWMFRAIVTSEVVGLEPITFERWMDFRDSPRSRVFLASSILQEAFTKRATTGPPPHSNNPEDDFLDAMEEAEELLYEVVQDRPAMADPWVVLLISGRGLGVDLEEIRKRFENAHSREPFRADASREYLQSLSKKWGGSNIATFDLAEWIEAEAPPASPAREALPMAHIEMGLLMNGKTDLAGYLTDPAVADELAEGLHDFLEAIPDDTPTEVLGVLNAYALAISVSDRWTARLVTETFARIDNRPTEFPWNIYADDINDVFSEIQADQLRFASRF